MTSAGAFTFVLHSHLPYARQAGMWPHGEEWVHEAIAETYLPLLDALTDLADEGVEYRITVSVTPILAEQLADPLIQQHFVDYATERVKWASEDVDRFDASGQDSFRKLAGFYRDWYAERLERFTNRYQLDLLGALKRLQDRGYVEISTSAATHGYLPLLARDSSIHGQIRTGVRSYERHFGKKPKAIWLPECAYRPAYDEVLADGTLQRRPGLESFLEAEGIRVFFTETHTVEGGHPVGKAAGDALGPYGAVQRRYAIPMSDEEQREPGTTFRAYWVGDAPGTVAVLGRNNRTGQQVWSGDFGYPGDAAYREFHRKDGQSGMQYWAIGGPGVDLGNKPEYQPDVASDRVRTHADHFAGLVESLVRTYHEETGEYGVIASNYDTELFGHWWFEGVDWLKGVLRRLAESDVVDLTTASAFVIEHDPERIINLPESSWGSGGTHFTWMNVDTEWMWPIIHAAESRIEQLQAAHPSADGVTLDLLNQATRELLLLQSSDWPFLVTTGQAKEYATQRFTEHARRFSELADIIDSGIFDQSALVLLDGLKERDNPFPDVDYRDFASRQGSAALLPIT